MRESLPSEQPVRQGFRAGERQDRDSRTIDFRALLRLQPHREDFEVGKLIKSKAF
jgi:hypothetical protein